MSVQYFLPSYEKVHSKMSQLITKNLSLNLYSNALFYAEKCFYFSINQNITLASSNIFELAKCLFLNKEYSRCVNLIQKYSLTYYNLNFLLLLGQALYACEDYDSVISFLEKEPLDFDEKTIESEMKLINSSRLLLLGKSYEMQENKPSAIKNYIASLECDSSTIEAFDILINHNLLNAESKSKLLLKLSFDPEMEWLYDYYQSKIDENIYMTHKSDIEYNDEKTNVIDILYKSNDQDLMKMEAEKFFIARDYINTYNKLKKLNEEDFYKLDIIPMLCSCMIELNKIGEIYSLAYKLANNCSEKYISWYAVGCYYYSIKKYDVSRKYFLKCNQMSKTFPEGWIALGNCYAEQDESDQALSIYRACLRLFPGCHYSNLYIGMEYLRTNNIKTAFMTFQNALLIYGNDPLLYNEIGIVYYKQKSYLQAEKYFSKGLAVCNEDKSITAQTLMMNLGHSYRKLRKFAEALDMFIKLYFIDSRNVDVLNSIGYTLSLQGNYAHALEMYHKANYIKSNNTFAIEMINKCLNDQIDI